MVLHPELTMAEVKKKKEKKSHPLEKRKSPTPKKSKTNSNEELPSIPKAPKKSHYLAIEMGLTEKLPSPKLKRKKRDLNRTPTSFPEEDWDSGYERRTVNSVSDITGPQKIPKPKLKKRHKLLDSEVNILQTLHQQPQFKNAFLKQELPTIEEDNYKYNDQNNTDVPTKKKMGTTRSKTPDFEYQPINEVLASINKMTATKSKKQADKLQEKIKQSMTQLEMEKYYSKYPVLKDKELIQKYQSVDITNNQKGRIRQVMRDIIKGASPSHLPEILNSKIQAILKRSDTLLDSDLRKIRVLHNMLKKSVADLCRPDSGRPKLSKMNLISKISKESKKAESVEAGKKKKKRYVLFVGNLPHDVTKEQLLDFFTVIREYVKDVRIQRPGALQGAAGGALKPRVATAHVEFDNAPVYEMALSMNHTMMGNRRINVLYSPPKKMPKAAAKAKSAKLLAMAKTGQLVGSIPLNRKRSQRRVRARNARRAEHDELDVPRPNTL